VNRWLGALTESIRIAPALAAGVAAVWFLLPFSAQFMLHPDDVIRLQHKIAGEAIASDFSTQQLFAGEIAACVALAALVLLLLGLLTVFYHRLQFAVVVWPVAGLIFGVAGNLLWEHYLRFVDPQGIAAGLVPAALTILWQRAAEGWAQDFVFGRGNRPRFVRMR
jgi:hypothetical protein